MSQRISRNGATNTTCGNTRLNECRAFTRDIDEFRKWFTKDDATWIGAKVPYWTSLLATLLACAMVPFQWVDIESVIAAALLLTWGTPMALRVLTALEARSRGDEDTLAALVESAPLAAHVAVGRAGRSDGG